jgi:cell division protein FtsW
MRTVLSAGGYLLLTAVALLGAGVVMVYSSSSALASLRYADSSFFLGRQVLRAVGGLVVMFIASRVPTARWSRWARWLLLASAACLLLVLALGVGPAQRWLRLPIAQFGLSFQPSEFAKLALVLYLADVLARKEEQMGDFQNGLLPRLMVVGTVVILIVFQPNLGTGLAVGMISMVMLYIGGARLEHLGALALGALPLAGASMMFSRYQLKRVTDFLNGGNYQVEQSLVALGSGGWFGVGLGNSLQKQQFLPEPHTDFVFALIGEEGGLLGTCVVAGLFIAFAVFAVQVAREASTRHGFLLATGIGAMVSVYAILNICVATGLMPTTGLPLPFISYGGSALIWNMAGVGIVLGVARTTARESSAWPAPGVAPSPAGR